MLGLKVAQENAEQVKSYLLEHDLLDRDHQISREGSSVIFPVIREFSPPFDFDAEFVEVELDERQRGQSLREALKPILTDREMARLVAAYDIVGSVAIIDIPLELERLEPLIGEKLMEINRSVTTVLKKLGGHEGELRTQRMACIAGEDTRVATVVENGVRLKVNVEEAYYSVRMATERKRILSQIKPGERILCLFSGVGPYPMVFSRHSKAKEIVGIELNPVAHELAQENAALNRCTNVHLLQGDAHEIVPRLARDGQVFDRITMPLPHTATEFLDDALSVSRKGTVVHFYSFQHENEFEKAVDTVRTAFRRNGHALQEYTLVKAGQHAPRIWRVCVDAVVG